MNKAYNTLSDFYKNKFGEKVYKITIDGSFTCPNRDGTCSVGGCIFCNGEGSGEQTTKGSIRSQVLTKIKLAKEKGKATKFISYFQSFTNTYDKIENLKKKYYEAISFDEVVGLDIATRPDCVNEENIKLLSEIAKDTGKYVSIELGLQTSNDETAKLINRGYKSEVFLEAARILEKYNIDYVVHIIVGLPNENENDILNTINFINQVHYSGIKIHALYVLKDTAIAKMYEENKYTEISREFYIKMVALIISRMRKDAIIHRLTGDGEKDKIIAPTWTMEKKKNLNSIDKYLWDNNILQGMDYIY